MKRRLLGIAVGIGVCLASTALGLTLLTAAGTIGIAGDYDMPPAQTRQFVVTAAQKLGGAPGSAPDTFQIPLLPWSRTTIQTTVTENKSGSHVTLSGHATKVKELKSLLDKQLPPLSTP